MILLLVFCDAIPRDDSVVCTTVLQATETRFDVGACFILMLMNFNAHVGVFDLNS